jgi:hypothetical protein
MRGRGLSGTLGREATVEVIVRIALMFFFLQFVIVATIMSVALLLARPEVPVLGRQWGHAVLARSQALFARLPCRVHGSAGRMANAMRSWRSAAK